MALITDPEQAKRLARAILADMMLYQHNEIAAQSPTVTGHVEEGRQLFRGRVSPELYEEFESALAASKLAPWGAPGAANDGGFTYRDAQQPLERPRERNSAVPLFIAIAVLAVASAVMAVLSR